VGRQRVGGDPPELLQPLGPRLLHTLRTTLISIAQSTHDTRTRTHDTQATYWLRWPGDARRLGLGLERVQACVDVGERGFVARGRGLAPDFEAGQTHVAAMLHCSRVRTVRRVAGARARPVCVSCSVCVLFLMVILSFLTLASA
jgi:hypothetical protein